MNATTVRPTSAPMIRVRTRNNCSSRSRRNALHGCDAALHPLFVTCLFSIIRFSRQRFERGNLRISWSRRYFSTVLHLATTREEKSQAQHLLTPALFFEVARARL